VIAKRWRQMGAGVSRNERSMAKELNTAVSQNQKYLPTNRGRSDMGGTGFAGSGGADGRNGIR
jgi:hypothetical protein